jgi:uncharacterized protein YjiS (DUF1127 family)
MTTSRSEIRQPSAAPSHGSGLVEGCRLAPRATHRRLFNALSSWRLRRTQRAQLHALSDAVLKDFGISRWEIDSIVNSPNRDASGRVR